MFVTANIFELPFGRGKPYLGQASRGLELLVGGWQLTTNLVVMSGEGFTPSYANCGADEDVGVCRPDRVGSTSVSDQPGINGTRARIRYWPVTAIPAAPGNAPQ